MNTHLIWHLCQRDLYTTPANEIMKRYRARFGEDALPLHELERLLSHENIWLKKRLIRDNPDNWREGYKLKFWVAH